jgi:hypothetical protein
MNIDVICGECTNGAYTNEDNESEVSEDTESSSNSSMSSLLPRQDVSDSDGDKEPQPYGLGTSRYDSNWDSDSRDSYVMKTNNRWDRTRGSPEPSVSDDSSMQAYQANWDDQEDDNNDELMLGAMEFPKTQKWLEDPSVWVGDTGATVHMTPHRQGMTNLKTASGKDAVTMGNGQSESASQIGDIPGTVCDKTGTTVLSATIKAALYLPIAMYNLFSITKLQREGWTLHGDEKCLRLTKGTATIKFDILIPTAKGMLYAMYHQRGSTEVANAGTTAGNDPQDTKKTSMSIAKAHDLLGHKSEDTTRRSIGLDHCTRHARSMSGLYRSKGQTKECPKASRATAPCI